MADAARLPEPSGLALEDAMRQQGIQVQECCFTTDATCLYPDEAAEVSISQLSLRIGLCACGQPFRSVCSQLLGWGHFPPACRLKLAGLLSQGRITTCTSA